MPLPIYVCEDGGIGTVQHPVFLRIDHAPDPPSTYVCEDGSVDSVQHAEDEVPDRPVVHVNVGGLHEHERTEIGGNPETRLPP